MSRSVALVYGFTEGNWHGKKFRRLLRKAGYSVVTNPKLADIIIAHSAGSFYIPALHKEQLLVLINPPYWPEKSSAQRGRDMTKQLITAVRPGNKPLYHIHKTARNAAYLIRHGKTNYEITSMVNDFDLAKLIIHKRTILIRNSNDPWLMPHIEHLQTANKQLQIYHISGDHDDCWQHPERYIDLLQSNHEER